ncbi:MAG: redoxin domain-containing protein [Phycisphaerales bacterium]|nr:redoxin domain-containing protein [Phycisphaerales bacterium]
MLGFLQITIVLFAVLASQDAGIPESHAWDSLTTRLNVEERSYLLMWESSDEGLALLDQHLERYPDTPHREQALYLKAIGLWGLFRYAEAAEAYDTYIEAYPNEQRSYLAMTRHIQSLVRSDQAKAAIEAATEYENKPAGEQRSLAAVDALALQGKPDAAKAMLQQLILSAETDPRAGRMIEMLQGQMKHLDLIGKPIQDFSVKAWKREEVLTPASFKGRVLLVEFWASWCKPCLRQMHHVVAVYRQYHPKGLDVLGVNLDEQPDRMQAAMDGLGMTWPQYNDGRKWDNALVKDFDVHRIPFAILVDQEGIVRYVNPPAAALDRLVPELLERGRPKAEEPSAPQPG